VADREEHDDIWSRLKRNWPQLAEYERQTARDIIPVVVLERTYRLDRLLMWDEYLTSSGRGSGQGREMVVRGDGDR